MQKTHNALMQRFPGCSQGPFFDTICHCLVIIFLIFAELKCNDDDDDESSSCNSLCQFLYHCHCLLLSLYICVISLKCNGKVGLTFYCVFTHLCVTVAEQRVLPLERLQLVAGICSIYFHIFIKKNQKKNKI